jgi:hypothetical protein
MDIPKAKQKRIQNLPIKEKEGLSGKIDAGMELAAPLNSELPSVAVAGGWAAIESLLTGPGDDRRVLAEDRMASITACSFARAELTALS